MPATADFEVKISSCKGPSRQQVGAVQNDWVPAEHSMDSGACFSEEVHFPEEQPIAGKSESPQRIPGFSNVHWGKGLRHRVRNEFLLFQGFELVWGVILMLC
jgi:hypothetical protein